MLSKHGQRTPSAEKVGKQQFSREKELLHSKVSFVNQPYLSYTHKGFAQ
jgi:hypothetical protein